MKTFSRHTSNFDKFGRKKISHTEQLESNLILYIKLCGPGLEYKRRSFEEH